MKKKILLYDAMNRSVLTMNITGAEHSPEVLLRRLMKADNLAEISAVRAYVIEMDMETGNLLIERISP